MVTKLEKPNLPPDPDIIGEIAPKPKPKSKPKPKPAVPVDSPAGQVAARSATTHEKIKSGQQERRMQTDTKYAEHSMPNQLHKQDVAPVYSQEAKQARADADTAAKAARESSTVAAKKKAADEARQPQLLAEDAKRQKVARLQRLQQRVGSRLEKEGAEALPPIKSTADSAIRSSGTKVIGAMRANPIASAIGAAAVVGGGAIIAHNRKKRKQQESMYGYNNQYQGGDVWENPDGACAALEAKCFNDPKRFGSSSTPSKDDILAVPGLVGRLAATVRS